MQLLLGFAILVGGGLLCAGVVWTLFSPNCSHIGLRSQQRRNIPMAVGLAVALATFVLLVLLNAGVSQ